VVNFKFNGEKSNITLDDGTQIKLDDPRAFTLVSEAWLRCGWDNKYVYGFSWLGRPIIQLPEDMIRIQELIYQLKPDIIIETGVAHGGSLIFYASLCEAMGKGRIIGIDIEIRPHNRKAIEAHELSSRIYLIEGDSTNISIAQLAKDKINKDETVLILLDSNHSKEHVLKELEIYSPMVSIGSYIVVCDGIMKQLEGAPRTESDWDWNNPISAIEEFIIKNSNFENTEPRWPFNEGNLKQRVTYWPRAYLKRLA